MSLIEYVIQELERELKGRINKLDDRILKNEARIGEIDELFISHDYVRAIIEKACPAAQDKEWWEDILV